MAFTNLILKSFGKNYVIKQQFLILIKLKKTYLNVPEKIIQ